MSPTSLPPIIDADVLIIGSGLAGLLLGLRLQAADLSVVLACKGTLLDSNSSMAQGGVAAVTGANPFDSPETHLIDTIKAGAGLTDAEAARGIIFGGQRLIAELDRLGVTFDKNPNGGHDLALEGGHKQARVLHSKDTTGRSITEALCEKIRMAAAENKHLTILENSYAVDLLTVDAVCAGAKFLCGASEIYVRAPHTVMATGGLGQVYERTTNPLVATGDGIALAYRAGAILTDMEFVQFHPTALRQDNAPPFLISEAARGAGATLLDHKGQRFVKRFHQDGELATRDIVARAIHSVMREHDLVQVFLDMRPIGAQAIGERFPNIVKTCSQYGIDVLRQPIPIAPAAHYMMGGIAATVSGRTSVAGLYAIGECACTGLHGANRLASNSLLEAGVMALNLGDAIIDSGLGFSSLSFSALARAQEKAALHELMLVAAQEQCAAQRHIASHGEEQRHLRDQKQAQLLLPADLQNFRSLMYRHGGLVRSGAGLKMLLNAPSRQLSGVLSREQHSARNIFQVGQLIACAALLRRESRGSHLRDDYDHTDDANFGRRVCLSKGGEVTPAYE
jgi:L-aspartate oxidase